MAELISIGDFSKASHLSIKTLRHYQEVGLLAPAEIDPDSGYRYYSATQIPTAHVIRRLRALQLPLHGIKEVLASPSPEARNRLVTAHLDRLQVELRETQNAVDELRALVDQPTAERPIEYRTVAATSAIAIRETIRRSDALIWWQGAIGELRAIATAQALEMLGPFGGIYDGLLWEEDRGEATVFLPTSSRTRTIGRVEIIDLATAELAVITHRGPLQTIDVAYGQLASHVARHEIAVGGPMREFYPTNFTDTTDTSRWRTEIGWPIFRADSGGA